MAISETSNDTNVPAVQGENTAGGDGILAKGRRGVVGISNNFQGVFGKSVENAGVVGESDKLHGVFGVCHNPNGGGVFGTNDAGNGTGFGVIGTCNSNIGVAGDSITGIGMRGKSVNNVGVVGESDKSHGVFGKGATGGFFESSVAGIDSFGVHGRGATGGFFEGSAAGISAHGGNDSRNLAGFFRGNVEVTQTVKAFDVFILGSDCAEDFDITSSAHIEPGTVMVIGDDARLVESHRAYDKRVAGIVSGAGDYKPGIVLGKDASRKDRVPLALIGKVFCKVDATYASIEVGDLLTTSPTQGHAMKAEDPLKAFGAVVGKALAPLREGRSLLPILVALQ